VAPKVVEEALYIYTDRTRSTAAAIVAGEISALGISIVPTVLSDDETIKSVQYALEVDDGEAETLGIAANRGLAVLSDDRAAARIASRDGIAIETILDLIFAWSSGRSADEIRDVLLDLTNRANFRPPKKHPYSAWFAAHS
jgi:predicted nucleic acid-binding protein